MSTQPIPFQNTYARLPERFFSLQAPSPVAAASVVVVNQALAEELGIDPGWLTSPEALQVLAGNRVAPGSEPLAQAYAGHQFGGFVPQLGDGRAILLGEVIDRQGHRRDIQLKGAGRTAFSRGGDGKCALGPAIREYLVSEAMAALGVPTTRGLAVIATGEPVYREQPMAGAIFVRIAASHLRVGTFEYFAARQDRDALQTLLHYAIQRHYPGAASAENPALAFLQAVVSAQASLIAQWMSFGFIHGVMNTDNCSISGHTIDFGPCAFMDGFHPQCVFSAIDRGGRYSWANQPGIAQWNLTRLAETLLPLMSTDVDQAIPWAEEALDAFADLYTTQHRRRFSAKLGLRPDLSSDDASSLIQSTLSLLAQHRTDFTGFFTALTHSCAQLEKGQPTAETVLSALSHPSTALSLDPEALKQWIPLWLAAFDPIQGPQNMPQANPTLIPRNHLVEHAIQSAYQGDYSPLHRLAKAWSQPFAPLPEHADLTAPPLPHEVVHHTFCGT